MKTLTIKYNASVLVAAGWRSIEITAIAEPNKTGKKATIIEVINIDGNGVGGYASRTGANRQKYNTDYIAKREIGTVKIVSKVEVV